MATPVAEKSRLKERFQSEIAPSLQRELGFSNPMQVPHVEKVVVNIGMGEAIANGRALEAASADLAAITGQRPLVRKAKNSIAQFRLREGMSIGGR